MNEVITQERTMTTPATLLQMAVQQNADVDKLEKLMDLQQRWEKDHAKKLFVSALNKFKSDPPKITRNAEVDYTTQKGRTTFKYASLDHICDVVGKALSNVGISFRWKTEQGEMITVTCVLTHEAGHDESVTLSALADTSGGKNAIQAVGSTVSYLQRYTLLTAVGLAQEGEDNDGGRPDITVDDLLNYLNVLRDWLPSIHAVKEAIALADYSTAKEAWNEIDEATMRILWRAPSKGGIFTTEERTIMKSDEWSKA